MIAITYILGFVVLLGMCVFIHEMGHLLGGKMVGIKAKVFSIGYGKGIWKKKFGDTTYQVTLIPFGGYCQFYGESAVDGKANSKDVEVVEGSFSAAAPWRRIVTVAMGPLFNLFFGIGIFFMMNVIGFESETNKIIIPNYLKSGQMKSVAMEAGIKDGDKILEIDGKKVVKFGDIQASIIFSDGKNVNVKVLRNDEILEFSMKPKFLGEGRYSIGVMPYGENVLIRSVSSDGEASKAGLEKMDIILETDGVKVKDISDFSKYVSSRSGESINLKINRIGKIIEIPVTPRSSELLSLYSVDNKKSSLLFQMRKSDMQEYISKKKIEINGKFLKNYSEFENIINNKKSEIITFKIKKQIIKGKLEITKRGLIGVGLDNNSEMVQVKYGIVDGFIQSFIDPYTFITLQLKGMGKLFSGKMDVRKNLSGPIKIGQIAGDVLYYRGIGAFILLMANISIILMIMNFLPIPVVDGGHLVFFTIEMIRGKPLPEAVMQKIQTVGVLLLMSLFVFVMINDVASLDFVQKLFK